MAVVQPAGNPGGGMGSDPVVVTPEEMTEVQVPSLTMHWVGQSE
jgi:hypothetical protein